MLNEVSIAERKRLLKLASALGFRTSSSKLPSITRIDRDQRLPLSFAQQRLWFLAQIGGAGTAYHISVRLRFGGDLDTAALRRALNRMLSRHEALRTTFVLLGEEPVQQIASVEESHFVLLEQDLRGQDAVEAELRRVAELEARTPIDLAHGPLIRGRLIRVSEDEHVLLITMHHIVSDGWSMGIFLRELSTLYSAFMRGEDDPLPELAFQYADYAVWQREWMAGEVLREQAEYWKSTLDGAPVLLELPTDHPRPAQMNYAGAVTGLVLEKELTTALKALSKRHGTTLYMTLLTAWAVLLARLSGQQDIVVGTPVANRGRVEIEPLIGFFVNTLALRIDLTGSPTVGEMLGRVRAQALSAQQHQDIPFEQVVEILRPARSVSHSPLFQVMFAWQNAEPEALDLAGLEQKPSPGTPQTVSKFDLTLALQETGERIVGGLEYATSLFEASTIERYLGHFRTLIEAMVANETQAIDRLTLLSASERHRIVYEWNETGTEYPSKKCVHELFEEQVEQTPGAIAIVYEEAELSYGELNIRANRLAHHLRELGVKPDDRVAICVERGFEMIVALLAILKAGGAYVPLDPAYPSDRLRFMLEDSAPVALLTQAHLAELFSETTGILPVVDLNAPTLWGRQPETNPDPAAIGLTAHHLAYVIYTSGSTGTPKGVMVQHGGVVNHIEWQCKTFRFSFNDSILQRTPISFDASVWEVWTPLAIGARLFFLSVDAGRDPDVIVQFIKYNKITIVQFIPSLLQAVIAKLAQAELVDLRYIFCGGEALNVALVRECGLIVSEGLINLYGPTEATIDVTTWRCVPDLASGRIPIGRPIANTQIYILDGHGEPVPEGVSGELYIGGAGVARGYLNRPALTAEKFVTDPFADDPKARMYRTGDLGRWLPDGNIEFLGRNDFQVKIRGFRIELGEIEARLMAHPGIRDAVVIAREDMPGDKRLVAYYASAETSDPIEDTLNAEGLRSHLTATLPEYMVPAAYVHLERLPLTPNGKLDRKALPAPDSDAYATRGYEAPLGETESILAAIWSDLLRVEQVGRHDNFFELGGHSLLAVRVISQLRQVLGIEVALNHLFTYPVLADFARSLENAALAELPPITRIDRDQRLPLSFAQQRLWFLAQMEGVSEAYHIPFRLRFGGDLDTAALRRALNRMLSRHEALRTTFVLLGEEPVQQIASVEESHFVLLQQDLRGQDAVEAELRRVAELEARTPFDLAHGPLIRGRLIRVSEDEHVLLITMHHIVSDGWSMGIFLRELSTLYSAFMRGEDDPLPELALQYADYAVWQREWMAGEVLREQAEYWKSTLDGAPVLLELPTDHPRPAQMNYAGAVAGLVLEKELTTALKALSKRHGTTLYMTLLTAWAVLLARLSGQQDIVVGTPVANRGRVEIEPLIGFFVNTLALRIDLTGSPTVGEMLGRVRAQALSAQQHQDIPFEQVVEILRPARSVSHSPLFQVMFAWQNAEPEALDLAGLEQKPSPGTPQTVSKFDLTLALQETGERIVGGLEYATSLFEASTIERYLGHFRTLIEAMVANETQAIDRLTLLSASERHRIVYEWNETGTEYPSKKCVHELFEEQVEQTPGAIAIVYEEAELSYGELNIRANRLAHHLRELGVKPDDRVAICVERGFEMIVALLAILKAGGAYVPLDPAYPSDRLRFMLEDSAPVALLTQAHLAELFSETTGILPVVDLNAPTLWGRQPETNPDPAAIGLTAHHLAYVIYTSGSTGTPKGVMVQHGNVTRLVCNTNYINFQTKDVIAQASNTSFDAATFEIWGALLNGSRLVILDQDVLLESLRFRQALRKYSVAILWLPVGLFNQYAVSMAEEFAALRYLVIGGDVLNVSSVSRFLKSHSPDHLINGYGPTETTTFAATHEIACVAESNKSIPIGRPIANTRIYILDGHGEPVPEGVSGELYIGGAGVARGYLNRPALTAEKFVTDPFADDPKARMYRTGDLGRWLPDGNIEFLGRNDFQVKIRGFRIELGEIEARLMAHPGIRDAVVIAREDVPGDKRLVAYYTSAETSDPIEDTLNAEGLRSHLTATLPEYMVPAAYVHLERLPLTPNGKLDRKALPAPDSDAYATRGYEAPLGETESILAAIWSDLLRVEQVGRHDDFFELGGHSLLAIALMERMRRSGLHMDVRAIFATPTLMDLAETVSTGGKSVDIPPSLIPQGCEFITPEMLPLVELTAGNIEQIVGGVEGGAGNVQDIYPLAPLQEGMLFHHLMAEEGDPYLLVSQASFDTRERLDSYLMAKQAVVDRHDILRTAILWEGLSEPVQVVWREAVLSVEEVALNPAEGDIAKQLYARFDPRHHRMDIRQAPLLRVYVAQDPDNHRWVMMLMHHHLTCDHTTMEVMQSEIEAHLLGQQEELAEPLPFRNFVAQTRLGISREEHESFFRKMLGSVDEPTMPFGLVDVQGDGREIKEAGVMLGKDLSGHMRERARKLGVSAASLCHLAWAQVLGRVSGREDVVFGTVLFGRMQGGEGADRVMGPFINTLPVRIRVGEEGVETSVRRTHEALAELIRHEHASLALAQRCSAVPAPAPLFSALLNYRHNSAASQVVSKEALRVRDGVQWLRSEERTNYPFTLSVDDFGDDFRLTAQVNASIDPMRVCEYMRTALEVLVAALAVSPGAALRTLDVMPASERHRIVYEWNETGTEYPSEKCVHELFEEQVEQTPGAIAIVYEEVELSYGELNIRANRLAHHLRELGVKPDDRVAICVERGFEMIVALLAILKAGGAYVPLDPAYPSDRLRFMLEDSAPVALLTQAHLAELFSETTGILPVVDLNAPTLWGRQPETNPDPAAIGLTAHHLAYVIYTSGSTGMPKGVMVQHGNVTRLVCNTNYINFQTKDVIAQASNTSFDAATFEIWGALLNGSRLVILDQDVLLESLRFRQALRKYSVAILWLPVGLFNQYAVSMAEEFAALRYLVIGGDVLNVSSVSRFLKSHSPDHLINGYGPTETTTFAATHEIACVAESNKSIPIGRPIANTRIYILDGHGEPVPEGVSGELYIGGAGVARGYLNRPALTAEKFVTDPFADDPKARMYRTGDLGRWLPDGNIEFLGRNDFQVKIRGFRIELGEIEARLMAHPGIRDAVVIAREDVPGDKRLVAYYTSEETSDPIEDTLNAEGLRSHLTATLPEYMVPAAYVHLERLPLTPNGKLDRKALPAPDSDAYATRGYEAPLGETESILAAIWSDLLRVERVGRHDNFFELGGHSLLAIALMERMRRSGLHMDVRAIFVTPTLMDLAETVSTGGKSVDIPPSLIPQGCEFITPEMLPLVELTAGNIEQIVGGVEGGAGNVQDIYPLAPLQEGMLFHHLMAEEGDPYLLVSQASFDTRERLDSYLMAKQAVVDRHDILRTAILWEGLSEPVQVVWREAVLSVEEVALNPAEGDIAKQLYARFDPRHHRMDIRQAPLLRVYVAQDPDNHRWVMMLMHHHLTCDHTTMEVMQSEIEAHLLGQQEELAEPLPFRNFVAQTRLGISREEHESFFRKMLGSVDEPTMPFGLVDVQGDGREIKEAGVMLGKDLSGHMRERARKLEVSAASLCHLAWAQVLGRVSGREDVVFGTVLFGRMQGGEGADRVMGPFINTLPVRIRVGEEGVETSVRRTHEALAELIRHEHASLALAQRCSAVPAPAPLFSALLNYRHSSAASQVVSKEALRVWEGMQWLRSEERTNYPFTLSVDDFGDDFRLTAQVNASIDPMRVCEYMRTALEVLVAALAVSPGAALRTLDVMPASERHRIVYEWNETGTEYPSKKCVHELFEEQVEQTPGAIAIVYEEAELSYGELNIRANRLAHHLRELGVKPDDRVAICVERGFEMIVALLAILKAGGAYVPLDPAYPSDRLRFMLEDSAPVALLTQAHLAELFSETTGILPVVDLNAPTLWGRQPETNPDPAAIGLTAHHLAYVIYTSGSTGTPKGVMVQHQGLCNLVWWHLRAFALHHGQQSSSVARFGFDAATWEIWPTLSAGATLALPSTAESFDPEVLLAWWSAQNLDISFLPTPIAELAFTLGVANFHLNTLLIGGDHLRSLPLRALPFTLVNNYGPTEVTVVATSGRLEACASVLSIGRPIANTQIYILDGHGEPVPEGVSGELYIGGAGVARGYLNRPALTAEKFVTDPFADDPKARMYRTGDLGRWLPDGNIEFLGRNDFQVKIRGFRIELGEIEARLMAHPGIRDAVVIAREDVPGDKRLVAYYASAETSDPIEDTLNAEGLRSHLTATLPEYMVPAAYVHLERLPLTPNGKLDRKALPAPDSDAYATRGYEAPLGETESILAAIWSDLLRVERVGRHDNFFELGGHSLLAIALMERMRRSGLHMDVRAIFVTPTLMDLAETVSTGGKSVDIPPSLIPQGCEFITPEMLPLVELTAGNIEQIVGGVEGGAGNVQDIYPLAPLQEGMLFHHLMAEEGDPYLLVSQASFDTRERLDSYLMAKQAVVDRHDILRTAILWEGLSEPVQVVWREAVLSVEEVALNPAEGDIAKQLYARFNPRHHRMDIRQAPLLRVYVAQDPGNHRWVMMLMHHHLTCDHTTMEVMQSEIEAHLLGQQEELAEPLPFRNFVAQTRLGISREEHESFFRKMLGSVDEPTVPFGLVDVQGDGREIKEAGVMLGKDLSGHMRERARKLEVSAASLCHLAWAQVLGRVSGREDVVFGTVLFGRMQGGEGADRVMGPFINTLPVRIRVGEEGVETSVRRTHEALAELIRHEHASLALAQRCSAVPAPAPLFSALLNYRHNSAASQVVSKEALRVRDGVQWLRSEERTNYPFTLSVDDFGDDFRLIAQVDASIDPMRVCEYMRTALEVLVAALAVSPGAALRTLDVMPASERHRIVYEWNETGTEYPSKKCVHELFEEQVEQTPGAIAIVYEEAELSYGELNIRANRLAHHLRELGVKPDDRVAICVERGFEMIVALLAILKAGGAYVPLDPAYPSDRLRFMLEDSAPVALLTQAHLAELFSETTGILPVVDLNAPTLWGRQPETNPDPAAIGLTAHHLAYVIYTSGSTGTPKGVMVQHGNVTRLFAATARWFHFSRNDVWAHFHSYAFDFSVWEIWGALLYAGRLVLVPKEVTRSPSEFFSLICQKKITILNQTPSSFRQLIAAQAQSVESHQLRQVVFGGEALDVAVLKPWYEQNKGNHTQLINMYGITETTVHVTYRPLDWTDTERIGSSPIGCRISDLKVYILDGHGEPVPEGVSGELYIGGAGVARGYLNRPALTAEKFVTDPFADDPKARMYRTGDLGRWLPDGNIEFLGRNDFQVKIRGFRIELGEIEARLMAHPGIRDAVVIAREDMPGDKRLVAYYTSAETSDPIEDTLNAEGLRSHLTATLPEYMVPAAYVHLERLPLTPNGKLDRKALPAPDSDAYATRGYEAPLGETESILAAIWSDLLRVEQVGRHDNFFELGGHSLLAIALMERMRQSGLQMDVRAIFATPTVAALAITAFSGPPRVEVPPNLISSDCELILPAMLPLVELTQSEINRIVDTLPGGAANVQDIYPLTPFQEGILFHHLLGSESDVYLNSRLESFSNRSQLDAYLTAIQAVINRNDILRTSVHWEGLSEPVQVVWRNAVLPVEEVVFDIGERDVAEQLWSRFNPRHNRLNLCRAPMLRMFTAHDSVHERWLLQWWYFHLLEDHTTMEVMQSEIEAHLLGQQEELAEPLPFRNFVAQTRLGISREEHESFFRKMLGNVDEPTAPFGLVDVQGDGREIKEAGVMLGKDLSGHMRERARKLGVSAASLCHLAWAQVLGRVSGREDVVFGTVLFGRMQGGEGADRVMGPFINTLPVRIRVGEEGVETSVRRTHEALAELIRHEHASLALAQRCSAVPAPAPLFSALLNYRHNSAASQVVSKEALRVWEGVRGLRGEERTNYPFTLSVDDFGDDFRLIAQVDASIDPMRVCEYMRTALEVLVAALAVSPGAALRTLDVMPASERHRIVYEWNETGTEYPSEKCVHELFEEQVEQTPGAIAIVYEEAELSYGELNIRANRLAHHLRELGVKPDDRVAICVERGFEMIVALLAILKAGGAYVPLDPAYPSDRLRFMLEDSAPVALLTQAHLAELFSETTGILPVVDLNAPTLWGRQPETNPDPAAIGLTAHHLAYVIYTSGSTGTPKGVMVQHGGVVNHIEWQCKTFRFSFNDSILQRTPISFDASVWEVWTPLAIGARLFFLSVDAGRDPDVIVQFIKYNKITIVQFIPSLLQAVIAKLAQAELVDLRYIFCGGEALNVALVRECGLIVSEGLINLYGPTEATIDVTTWRCVPDLVSGRIPIGRPIANTQIYILDGHGEPVPEGVSGELYIGGAGVARGYLNRPALTAEKFVTDPFADDPKARMYRTGDLGRWLPDGNIEFLGRNDFQVKIRGFRIELGEIEARLMAHPGIRDAVVIAREDMPGDKRLVAYYASAETSDPIEDTLNAEGLRSHLTATLPEYMVPAAYVHLERLPLTPNGKLDRKALPAPDSDAYATRGYEAPLGETESILAAIWSDLLRVEQVGRHDNFFELGGHSLLAVRVISQLRQVLGIEVALNHLFTYPVLADFARSLENAALAELPPITRIDRDQRLPLSFAQQRLWFLAQMEGVSEAYHIPFRLRFGGDLDTAALRRALNRMLSRHEALRTTFVLLGEEPVQQIASVEESHFVLLQQDLRGQDAVEAELRRVAELEARTPFDLAHGPLIRGRLIRVSEDEHVLLITMHHIVSDGWSMGIFLRELSTLYSAFMRGEDDPLPELALQYADYAVWQREWMAGEVLREQAEYWKSTLDGAPVLLELPIDHPRPAQMNYAGAVAGLVLEKELTTALKALSKRHGTTLYMTLLTAWAVLLARLSGQQDIVVGTPVANRGRVEIEPLIGLFVNTLALRIDLTGSPTVGEMLGRVRAQALSAQQHQDIPFEQVVEILRPARSVSHSPLFQVMFAWQNAEPEALDLAGLEQKPSPGTPQTVSKFDLTLALQETGERIVGGLEYATSLFEASTIERYLGHFRTLIEAMVANETQAIDRLTLLSASERHRIVYEWNETGTEYPSEKCVHELFEEQVEQTPGAIAIVYEEAELSYGELNIRANRLAHHLRELGVKPDDRVAICVERGFEMIVALLAILKAGGAYVPLDPAYPSDRLRFMLEDSAPVALLTQAHLAELFSETTGILPVVDLNAPTLWGRQPETNPDPAAIGLTAHHLAYVIYTSGSTGTPKGVAVEHRNVLNYLHWALKAYAPMKGSIISSSLSFDATVTSMYGPLLCGGAARFLPEHQEIDHLNLQITNAKDYEVVKIAPSHFDVIGRAAHLKKESTSIGLVIIGGEVLSASTVRLWREIQPDIHLVNEYGPTETVVGCVVYKVPNELDELKAIPIGRPIANTQIYILDGYGEPVPEGVSGELYIGGAGVARGYLNRPALTAEKFVTDPFADDPKARMYRTGDLGRWLRDGNIEFLGRNDFQVKIRGFRIELGEIEARLMAHPGIRDAVVIAREDVPGDKRLVAYYTSAETSDPIEDTLNAEGLRSHLTATLPEYMVPAAYVHLERLPLTPNGKLDRKALPAPDSDAYATRGYEAPLGETESILAAIWSDLLRVEQVGRHDNFFELGGHSLLAITLIERMRRVGLRVDVRAIFLTPTLVELAIWASTDSGVIKVPANRIPAVVELRV